MITNDYLILSLFILYAVCFAIQFFYYIFIYYRFIRYKSNENKTNEPVSVIICARNEEENLKNNLPLILEQDYPEYEVIVVNDCSDDDTEEVLKAFKAKYSHLRTTFLKEQERFWHGKKLALTVGIKAAKHEWLLLTDADCRPTSNKWIELMAKHFTADKSIVLGYGGYERQKGFLNKLIRFDAAFIAIQYLSFALFGVPYMGVGRNLAYRKSLFFSNKGFASHARIESGDDDLFINETANKSIVTVEFSEKAHTRTNPKNRFSDWVDQKKRHFTTFTKYKAVHKILLALEPISRVVFYFLFVFLLVNKLFTNAVIIIGIIRLLFQTILFYSGFKKLNERDIVIFGIFFDILIPFINLYIYLANKIRPQKRWR